MLRKDICSNHWYCCRDNGELCCCLTRWVYRLASEDVPIYAFVFEQQVEKQLFAQQFIRPLAAEELVPMQTLQFISECGEKQYESSRS